MLLEKTDLEHQLSRVREKGDTEKILAEVYQLLQEDRKPG